MDYEFEGDGSEVGVGTRAAEFLISGLLSGLLAYVITASLIIAVVAGILIAGPLFYVVRTFL